MITSLIVAASENQAIGKDNQLLCHLPNDLKYFKKLTSGHCIIMGRKTYESIGKPLPNRTNMVLSRSGFQVEGVQVFNQLGTALAAAAQLGETEAFVIGGDTVYKQALPLCNRVYLTRIHHQFEADAFFPELASDEWELVNSETFQADEKHPYSYSFQLWERKIPHGAGL